MRTRAPTAARLANTIFGTEKHKYISQWNLGLSVIKFNILKYVN